MICFLLLAAFAFCLSGAAPSGYARGYGYGTYNQRAFEVVANRYNAARQFQVNHIAEHVGSGTGTARLDGVPGTGYGYHSYGYGPYDGYRGYYGYNDHTGYTGLRVPYYNYQY